MKDETTAVVRKVMAAQARTASPLIVAANGLMYAGTVPALLAARDVIQREINRLEGK